MTTLGTKIKLHRELRGWNQKELAEKADVSPATVSGVENGRFVPTPTVLHRIAAELGVPFHELVELIPEPKLETLLEVGALYLARREDARALELVHRIRSEAPPMQEYQRDEMTLIEASALLFWEPTRMQAIETLYSLSYKLEGVPHSDQAFVLRVQNALGNAWTMKYEFITALHHYTRAIELLNNFPQSNERIVAAALYNMGECLRWLGRDREAIAYLEQALPLVIKNRNYMSIGGCYFSLGTSYHHLGEMQNAANAYREAIPWFEAAKSKWFAMRCRSLAAFFCPEPGEDALAILEEELVELRDLMQSKDVALTTTRIAKVHLDRNELEHSKAAFEKADLLSADLPPRGERAYFLLNYAHYFYATKDYEAASHYAFEAADLYALLRFFHPDLQQALRVGKEAVLRLRESSIQKNRP